MPLGAQRKKVNETSAQKLVFPQKGHYSGKIEKLRNTVARGFIAEIGSVFASGRFETPALNRRKIANAENHMGNRIRDF